MMQTEITEQQAQALMDVISAKCDELDLEPEQVLDGISRTLLAAAQAFGTKELSVKIAGTGSCEVRLED